MESTRIHSVTDHFVLTTALESTTMSTYFMYIILWTRLLGHSLHSNPCIVQQVYAIYRHKKPLHSDSYVQQHCATDMKHNALSKDSEFAQLLPDSLVCDWVRVRDSLPNLLIIPKMNYLHVIIRLFGSQFVG